MSSEFFGPARLRRWAVTTKYGLEAFANHGNHTDSMVEPSSLEQKFGCVYVKKHKPKTPKALTSEPQKSS